jgi:hypothetical protein
MDALAKSEGSGSWSAMHDATRGALALAAPAAERPWISTYALRPQRMTDGRWAWLRAYEWRWQTLPRQAPLSVTPERIERRLRAKT